MPNLTCQVSRSAIVFIDPQVADYQSLIAGVKPGTEVVVLEGDKDAIEQITEILACRTNIESIHIVSHGAPGSLQLGNGRFSEDNLSAYSQQLQGWQSAFSQDAEILIYGCNVASVSRVCPTVRRGFKPPSHSAIRLKPTGENSFLQSSEEDFRYETGNSFPGGIVEETRDLDAGLERDGFTFIKRIAQLTNTNVAASKNLTGNATKGGDWELEATTGEIQTPLVFEAEVLASYEYVLNSFSGATNFGVGTTPRGINVGNFNADTFPDLVVTNQNSDNISILLGDGTGSFGTATNFAVGSNPVFVTSGLFNNDNFPDLTVANASGNISILLGNGTGGFGTATNFTAGNTPISIATGNFNADNFLDLAVVNANPAGTGTVSILLGNGTGSFDAAPNIIVGLIPGAVVVGNFNADSFADLAVANSFSNNISIVLGNGSGGFSAPTNFGAGTNPNSLALGDFNADNLSDIAVVNGGSNNVSILLGNGTGGFGTATNFSAGTGLEGIVAKDFSGDGKLDLAVSGTNGVAILAGNGNGGFSTPINFAAGTDPISIVAGNFNADTFPDLAVANNSSDNVSILLNTPTKVSFVTPPVGNTYNINEGAADTVINVPVTISNSSSFGDVIVPISIDPSSTATQGADYTLSTTSLTFPANTTNLTQNIAVTIKADNIVDSNEQIVLNFGTITGGTAVTGSSIGSSDRARISILDRNSFYTIAANPPTISEGNSGTTPVAFTITSNGSTEIASTVDYTIGGTATNGSDYNNIGGTSGATAATGKITFSAGETSKTITLDVLGDADIEGDETVSIALSNPVSQGGTTPTITTVTAIATIANDDTAGITVNPTAITTTETGGTAQFTVKLNAKPSANVTIGLSSDNLAEGAVSTNSLTFTPANWNVEQTVTVTGVDDFVADGNQSYNIITAPAASTDLNFNTLNPDDVAVTNSDNETPGITVNPTAGLITTEAGSTGGTAKFSVVLNTQPTASVTIALNSDNLAEGSVSTNSITFTTANWNVPQEITVTGVDDSIADGDINYKIITANAVSTDANYNLEVADVSLTNKDNDTAGVIVNPTETAATEGGAAGSYTVALKSQPTALVTVNLTTGEQIESIAPLTFTPNNWNTAQTVTVKAVDDAIVEGAQVGNVTHSVTSTDLKYNGIAIAGVTVAIADNDVPPPTPTPTPPTPTPPTPTPPTPTPPTPTPPT
ncbi:MAG: DUF4347 domain-containing protein, partial [Richelia sp. CSU_2_1]|nr:DUF4347 domain-containing protein [Richelia sp. CSU_2_1]